MSNDQKRDENLEDLPEVSQPRDSSRRQFSKIGLAASGVLVTLASKPVLGCQVAQSPSGFISGNVSHRGSTQGSGGLSPGYWKNHSNWPSPLVAAQKKVAGTKFSSVFDCTKSRSTPYATISMTDLLSHQSFDTNNLGMHIVAAYLSAMNGMTPFLPPTKVIQMFNQWAATGYFYPIPTSTTIKWDSATIVDYLKKTQD